MATDPHDDVVRVATAPTPQEVHVWKQVLDDEGISSNVVGDFLDAGLGSLDSVPAELWVRRADAERARTILDEYHRNKAAIQAETDEAEEEE